MTARRRLVRFAHRPHLPRRTVRLRLTGLYGLLFLLSGVALLVITNFLVDHAERPSDFHVEVTQHGAGARVEISGSTVNASAGPTLRTLYPPPLFPGVVPSGLNNLSKQYVLTPEQAASVAAALQAGVNDLRSTQLDDLRVGSEIALGVMVLLSMWLGWLMAGRALRPLRVMTATARDISATNLHARLALDGPDDELHELGRTINDLLARLETSFEAQRRFVANASHELRTPLARQRTLAQVVLADPDASVEDLRAAHERVLASGEQQERLIEALLTLARGEAGLERREPVDLSVAADSALLALRTEPDRGIEVDSSIMPATVMGDPRLIERLVANLVDNALRHNVSGGHVHVTTGTRAGSAVLSVSNTGPVIAASEVDRLFQPFRRLGPDRTGHGDGVGLGLSIVQAIALAHGATVHASARPGGGLTVDVTFPPVPPPPAIA